MSIKTETDDGRIDIGNIVTMFPGIVAYLRRVLMDDKLHAELRKSPAQLIEHPHLRGKLFIALVLSARQDSGVDINHQPRVTSGAPGHLKDAVNGRCSRLFLVKYTSDIQPRKHEPMLPQESMSPLCLLIGREEVKKPLNSPSSGCANFPQYSIEIIPQTHTPARPILTPDIQLNGYTWVISAVRRARLFRGQRTTPARRKLAAQYQCQRSMPRPEAGAPQCRSCPEKHLVPHEFILPFADYLA